MPNATRVIVARDNWKKLAVQRRKEAESKDRQAKKWRSRYAKATSELAETKRKILLLEKELKKKLRRQLYRSIFVYFVYFFFFLALSLVEQSHVF